MRASNAKSSPLRRLVGGGVGVLILIGGGVIAGDCAGARALLPRMPLDRGAGVACPLDVAAGYDCAGVEAPELLPIDAGGVLCPPLAHGVNDGAGWANKGSEGEEGVALGERLERL